MSVKGEMKEAAGFVKEEFYGHGKTPEDKKKAQEGRDLRNEGRIEDRKAPKTTKPGTGSLIDSRFIKSRPRKRRLLHWLSRSVKVN